MVLREAEKSASVTHNHSEGIKGAQAIATAIFLARSGESKEQIRKYVEHTFGYNLQQTIDEIRPTYQFDALYSLTLVGLPRNDLVDQQLSAYNRGER